ncbi:phospholipase [Polaribacter filamentus]|uniref:Phospholipase n=1 Tax=Polaribacter filamentus TaxID=53483 RepID=A0A2S7KYS4_9FLAO|nr:phospholipase [Polaribacter filamentus]
MKKYCYTLLLLLCFSNSFFSQKHTDLYDSKSLVYKNDTLQYRILLPENFTEDKQYPLVLVLHGAGERGNNNSSQLVHGSNLFASDENREQFPAIVIFPQCPKGDYWANATIDRSTKPIKLKFSLESKPTKSLELVMNLLQTYLQKPFVKKEQIYVGGLSMGGLGTFEILYRQPNTFAAAFAICGAGNPEGAKEYAKNTNLWVFHGANDDVINPQESINMVSGILKYGGKPNFSLYANDNHNSWDSAFAEPALLPWLFSKSKRIKNDK